MTLLLFFFLWVGGICLLRIACKLGTHFAVQVVRKSGGPSWNYQPCLEWFDLEKDRTPWIPRHLDLFWQANNADEDYDRSFRPDLPHLPRKILYALRNPFHNFFFYEIGLADRPFIRHGIVAAGIWGPDGCGVNIAFIQRPNGAVGYPFISFRNDVWKRELQGYLGWRERGNFGLALRWRRKRNSSHPRPLTGQCRSPERLAKGKEPPRDPRGFR